MFTLNQQKIDEINEKNALAELSEIDFKSIRSIREYIAAQQDAPQILKDREAAVVEARAKIK